MNHVKFVYDFVGTCAEIFEAGDAMEELYEEKLKPGFYWWFHSPGCVSDDPQGPFTTAAEAEEDYNEGETKDD